MKEKQPEKSFFKKHRVILIVVGIILSLMILEIITSLIALIHFGILSPSTKLPNGQYKIDAIIHGL